MPIIQSASASTSRLYPMDYTSDHKSLVRRYLSFPDPFYQVSGFSSLYSVVTLPELHFHDAYSGAHQAPHPRFSSRFPCRRHSLYQSYRLKNLGSLISFHTLLCLFEVGNSVLRWSVPPLLGFGSRFIGPCLVSHQHLFVMSVLYSRL